ncbi:MAG: carbohydrate esterase [Cytophagaceae bacterium]|nr:carbohydrate esterase [Cytophagaceae bacterium]
MPDALHLELTTDADDERPVFIGGNFNDWQPDQTSFQLQRIGLRQYQYAFPADFSLPNPLEYKYTRGSWADVELSETGEAPPNRVVWQPTTLQRDHVPHWRRAGEGFAPQLMPHLLDIEGFELPILGRQRRLRVLLPADYEAQPKRRYPTLYLLDAQNLVQGGAGFGDWAVERNLAILKERGLGDIIVVGIDHGEEYRKSEFNPYAHLWLGRGEGKVFLEALVGGVKPFIDSQFRTSPDRKATGIGGSSLGGLLSLYAGIKAWPVFGRVLVFSPALWVSARAYSDAENLSKSAHSRFYLFGGGQETKSMKTSLERMNALLSRHANVATHFSFDPEGRHEEARWAREFPKATAWLFSD